MANTWSIKGTNYNLKSFMLGVNGNIVKTKDISTIQTRNSADNANISLEALTLISTQTTGTSPISVTSTTKVDNLNSDMVDGLHTATASTISTVAARDSNGDITTKSFIAETSVKIDSNYTIQNNSTNNVLEIILS